MSLYEAIIVAIMIPIGTAGIMEALDSNKWWHSKTHCRGYYLLTCQYCMRERYEEAKK